MTDSKSLNELEALLAKATAAMRAHEAFMLTHDYDMDPDAPDDSLSAIADELDAAWNRRDDAAARERDRLREALRDANETIVAFAGPWAARYAQEHNYTPGHLHPLHYDILAKAGARMDDFTRTALAGQP